MEELQPFQEPDLSTLGVGSACLAKHSDGIWYTAKITGEGAGPFPGPRGKVEAEINVDLKLGPCS